MVCSPRSAGWDTPGQSSEWQKLGFLHRPDFGMAQAQHQELCRQLQEVAEIVPLPPASDLSLDAVYAHDPSLPTDYGAIIMNPGKANRRPEARRQAELYRKLGVTVLGEIRDPGTTEAGDIVWLDSHTLLVGSGYRTNTAGIAQLRSLLAPKGVDVLTAPLPYGPGPTACLHLMSLISLLDEHTALVELPWLAVETVELLQVRGYKFIEIDYSERDTLACNVLSLGNKRLLALEENAKTNANMHAAGFDVRTFPGSELCINGSGGPTCLTRPLLRG
jgi:N-dimethylarginine dimethylaminohydrolase